MLFSVLPQENLFFYHFSPVSKVRQGFLIKRYIIATKPGKRAGNLLYPGCLRLSFQLVNYHFTADTVAERLRLT